MRILRPAEYRRSIFEIDLDRLKANGFRAIMLDLDNTLVKWNDPDPTPGLLDWLELVKRKGFAVLPIGTSARVGGGAGRAEVEAMEGFAVLRAAAAAGVPALELRAISNAYDDDRDDWRVEEALEALAAAVATLIDGAVPNHA